MKKNDTHKEKQKNLTKKGRKVLGIVALVINAEMNILALSWQQLENIITNNIIATFAIIILTCSTSNDEKTARDSDHEEE